MKRVISGYTNNSAKKLVLNSGAWFKNYIVGEDDFDSAVESGKLLGATQGGGKFSAIPTLRTIEIDGIMGSAKGTTAIDSWEVSMEANIVEISADTFATALGSSYVSDEDDYTMIRAKNFIEESDYIDNITWLGTLSGSDEPVIIQIFNALSTTGLDLQTQDKSQAILLVNLKAHFDMNSTTSADYAPFVIYYPKSLASPTIDVVKENDTSVKGGGLSGATVKVYGGTVPANTNSTVDVASKWSVTVPAQTAGTKLYAVQIKDGKNSLPVSITVESVS